jgi:hypothetical protein
MMVDLTKKQKSLAWAILHKHSQDIESMIRQLDIDELNQELPIKFILDAYREIKERVDMTSDYCRTHL